MTRTTVSPSIFSRHENGSLTADALRSREVMR